MIPDSAYYVVCAILVVAVLLGIHLMSRVERAHLGNKISALAVALAIILTLVKKDIFPVWFLYAAMAAGLITGLVLAAKVKMIAMPQLVALLNGSGGAASAIVASFSLALLYAGSEHFAKITSSLAIVVGMVTLTGSLVAAGKLHKIIAQKPVMIPAHRLLLICLSVVLLALISATGYLPLAVLMAALIILSSLYGVLFSVRVGGADMPITISLLNSLSGVAAAIAGFAVKDILLVSIGGIVGASGLFLTQIMCRAMNRSLADILLGKTSVQGVKQDVKEETAHDIVSEEKAAGDPADVIREARQVIIVPGYGMALAQSQHLVRELAGILTRNGAVVRYAIHPVAGRMPGHMDVLLVEAGVAFNDVFEMETINNDFKTADVTIVVGANDVLNSAARNAQGTPIYGMPILNVDQCRNIVIFNYDLKPGYSGVDNPIYNRKDGVWVIQGDAKETVAAMIEALKKS